MTSPEFTARREVHLTAALRALETAEADLRAAGKPMAAMRVAAILNSLGGR